MAKPRESPRPRSAPPETPAKTAAEAPRKSASKKGAALDEAALGRVAGGGGGTKPRGTGSG